MVVIMYIEISLKVTVKIDQGSLSKYGDSYFSEINFRHRLAIFIIHVEVFITFTFMTVPSAVRPFIVNSIALWFCMNFWVFFFFFFFFAYSSIVYDLFHKLILHQ